jgi:hypothetical protein
MSMRNWLIGGGLVGLTAAVAWLYGVPTGRFGDPPAQDISEVNAPGAAGNATALTMALPAPASGAMTAGTALSASTLATAGPQTLRLQVIEYVGGPTLQDWPDGTGKTISLAAIFANANVNINVIVHRPPPLPNTFTQGQRLQPEELHAMQVSPPPGQPGTWDVTAFILPVAHESGDLGEMFDKTTRSRFAVFGPAHAGPDQARRILRTTAHELGHALNLFHNDGDGDVQCCARLGSSLTGTSIMNADRCLQPGSTSFGLSSDEANHLLHHDIEAVRPGSKIKWDECPKAHSHWDKC